MKPTKDMQPNKDIACGASSGFPIYWGPNLPDPEGSHNIYYTRQLLCNSLEKRRIDLLTITATQESVSDTGEKESSPIGFSDEFLKDPPWKFPNRQIIFVSSRVHPGEITSQFVLLGFMNFILSGDERAKSLRKLFVFKIVPMVNPDGVSIGHYRLNSVGLNLNRYYDRPNTGDYESVGYISDICNMWKDRLRGYIDLHSHATRRGCFLFGNNLKPIYQVWNLAFAKLVSLNCSHFDLTSCNFSEENMIGNDKDLSSKEGSGRVGIHGSTGVLHSYTIECNYWCGRKEAAFQSRTLSIPKKMPIKSSSNTQAYIPNIWGEIGKALVISWLDLYGYNPSSVLPRTHYKNIDGLIKNISAIVGVNEYKKSSSQIECTSIGKIENNNIYKYPPCRVMSFKQISVMRQLSGFSNKNEKRNNKIPS
eukprot:GHVL01036754.1.p1 GENE.GHVL01036754.1~~GHVL01036754.1.p1  ORF type:complete len:421 (+),score=85.51 GHVL01036754.1:297-1559(+)